MGILMIYIKEPIQITSKSHLLGAYFKYHFFYFGKNIFHSKMKTHDTK